MTQTNFVPFFVGHAFTDKKMDDLRDAINEAVVAAPQFRLKAIYADEVVGSGHIFDKIKVLIAKSMFCVFDISENDRPNIYFELGFAHGIRKPHFLICQTGAKIPSDLSGYEYLPYKSYKDLREQFAARIPHMVNIAFQFQPKQEIGRVELIGPVLKRLAGSRATQDELFKIAQDAGFSKAELTRVLNHFAQSQIVGNEEGLFFLRPDGQEFLKQFISTYKDEEPPKL